MEDMTLERFIFYYISVLYTCDEVNKIRVLVDKNIFPFFFALIQFFRVYLCILCSISDIQPQIGIKAFFFRDL